MTWSSTEWFEVEDQGGQGLGYYTDNKGNFKPGATDKFDLALKAAISNTTHQHSYVVLDSGQFEWKDQARFNASWNTRINCKSVIICGNGETNPTLCVFAKINELGNGFQLSFENINLEAAPCFIDLVTNREYERPDNESISFCNVNINLLSSGSPNFIYVSHNQLQVVLNNVNITNFGIDNRFLFNLNTSGKICKFEANNVTLQSGNILFFNTEKESCNICDSESETKLAKITGLTFQGESLWSINQDSVANIALLENKDYKLNFPSVIDTYSLFSRTSLYVNSDSFARKIGYNYRVGDISYSQIEFFSLKYYNNLTPAWSRARSTNEIVYNISTLPNTVELDPNIPADATQGVLYNYYDDYATVAGYIGDSVDVIIANEVSGKPVTQIEAEAFQGKNIESVVIPSNIKEIGSFSFRNCPSLRRVQMPNGVEKIQDWAFSECVSLEEITFAPSVNFIGEGVLERCNSLHTLTTSIIGNGADNKNIGYFFRGAIPASLDKIVITDCTEIPDEVFKDLTNVTEITVLGNIAKIGEYAFANCQNLTRIVVPNTITEIGNYAFANCQNLTEVPIPNSVTKIGSFAFTNCRNLTEIVVPNTIAEIGSFAFANCTGLTEMVLPVDVQTIGEGVLSGCSSLVSVILPFIGQDADSNLPFGYIFGTNSYENSTEIVQVYYDDGEKEQSYYIPSGLNTVKILGSTIPYGAFYNCCQLTNIEVDSTTTEIGVKALTNCTGLTQFILPNNLSEIKNYTFLGCSGLSSIEIPDTVIKIGVGVFKDCVALETVSLSDESLLEEIGGNAFANCTSISEIYIPEKITSIESNAYSGCGPSLQWITVNNRNTTYQSSWNCLIEKNSKKIIQGSNNSSISNDQNIVTQIGENAFKGCSALRNITIPSNITYIHPGAFSGCSGLEEISISFIGSGDRGDLYPQFGSIFGTEQYDGSYHADHTLISEEVITFYIPDLLKVVKILDAQTQEQKKTVPRGSFEQCHKIESVWFYNGIQTIDERAFYGCTSLTNIYVSSSIMEIKENAFNRCDELQQILYYGNQSMWSEIEKGEGNDNLYEAQISYAAKEKMDFLGFTFNGIHIWYDLHVLRVIKGDRYTEQLAPQMKEIVAEPSGNDGQFYFGTYHQNKTFQIDLAFDNLSETDFRNLRKFCNGKELGDLIFDESPYKVYTAKITGTPQLDFLCFEVEGERVYKGEGSIQFTCYWPYAHTPNSGTKISEQDNFGRDGKVFSAYDSSIYNNKDQWRVASGIEDTFYIGNNFGDIPAPFIFSYGGSYNAGAICQVGENIITITNAGTGLVWNSKTGLVTSNGVPIDFTGDPLATIPVGENNNFQYGIDINAIVTEEEEEEEEQVEEEEEEQVEEEEEEQVEEEETVEVTLSTDGVTLEYDYWYY